ncbi:hypothetical protein [uncultured Campylobacter sp.]|nr:hypothetical protein [uncultured Campylobacter sp.]
MGAHRRLKFELFKKKEVSYAHERLKFKLSNYERKLLIAYPKNLRRNQAI